MSNVGNTGLSHTMTEIIKKVGLTLHCCKHCGGEAEFRRRRIVYTSSKESPAYGWVVCLSCSIQTSQYSLKDDNAYKFIASIWNRSPNDGDFEVPFTRRGSHYEEL